MPDNPEVPLPKDVVAKPKKPSARGFLDSIRTSLGWEPKVAAPPAAAEASIAATPPPAGEAVGASPTPFDVLREAPAFVPTAKTPDLPVSPASLLPPVPEEEWQRIKLATDMRGSTGEAMAAASAEVPAPETAVPTGQDQFSQVDQFAAEKMRQMDTRRGAARVSPVSEAEWQRLEHAADMRMRGLTSAEASASASATVPIPGGEPRDLDASEVAAMYRQTPTAPLAEVPAPSPAAAELPDWLTPPLPAALDLPDWMRPPASPVTEGPVPVALPPTEVPSPAAPGEEAPALGTANLDRRSLAEETNERGWEKVVGEMCDDPFFTVAYGSTGSAIAASAAYQLRDEISRGAIDKGTFTFRVREVAKVVEGQRKSEGPKTKRSLPGLKKEMAENPISKIAFDATKSTVAAAVGYELSPQIMSGFLEKAEFITLVKTANALMNGLPL